MVGARRTAGFSMLEATIALVVIAAVASALVTGSAGQIRATGAAFRAAAAQRLAESVLETARHAPLIAGETPMALDETDGATASGARVVRVARQVEPGLWEVQAVVTWTEPGEDAPRESRLVTWIAREDGR